MVSAVVTMVSAAKFARFVAAQTMITGVRRGSGWSSRPVIRRRTAASTGRSGTPKARR